MSFRIFRLLSHRAVDSRVALDIQTYPTLHSP